MKAEHLHEAVEDIAEDLGLSVTSSPEGEAGGGMSVWPGEDDDDETRVENTELLMEFKRRARELGIRSSRIRRNDSVTRYVDVGDDDNKDFSYVRIIRDCKTSITFSVCGRRFRIRKSGRLNGEQRYTLIGGTMYWDKNYRVSDGVAVSTNIGYITDDDECWIKDQSMARDVLSVKYPPLREMLLSDDWCGYMTHYSVELGEFNSCMYLEGALAFYTEFADWLEKLKVKDMSLLFEGIFFADAGDWLVNGRPVTLG